MIHGMRQDLTPQQNPRLQEAARAAVRLAGDYPLAGGYHRSALEEAAPGLVERACRLVEEETGLSGGGPPAVAVIDRAEWIERNLAFFTALAAPAAEQAARQLEEEGVAEALSRRFVTMEMGLLLGFLSRHVLGQYELVLPSSEGEGEICLPAPNILEFERRRQLRPSEFRFWVALHESTHRLQFAGVPWLRSYFLGLASGLVSFSRPDRSRLALLASRIRRGGLRAGSPLGEAGLLGLMASPDELRSIDRVQALMSLLEGHGHAVMDRIGARELVSWRRMAGLVSRRRRSPRAAALMRLAGLEMKMRQYEEGKEFISAVERRAGWGAVDLAWQSPEALPTRAEIADPEAWLVRVG